MVEYVDFRQLALSTRAKDNIDRIVYSVTQVIINYFLSVAVT